MHRGGGGAGGSGGLSGSAEEGAGERGGSVPSASSWGHHSGSGSFGGSGHRAPGSSRGSGSVLKELQEEKVLAVTFAVLRVGWAGAGRVALEVTGFGLEASPSPVPGLPPFLELPTLRRGGG